MSSWFCGRLLKNEASPSSLTFLILPFLHYTKGNFGKKSTFKIERMWHMFAIIMMSCRVRMQNICLISLASTSTYIVYFWTLFQNLQHSTVPYNKWWTSSCRPQFDSRMPSSCLKYSVGGRQGFDLSRDDLLEQIDLDWWHNPSHDG